MSDAAANLLIREASPADAAGMAGILNTIVAAGEPVAFDAPLSVEAETAYLEAFPERGLLLIAVDSDTREPVAFQSAEPFAAYSHVFDHVAVIGTYVSGSHRRRGVASRLFAATFEAAPRKGYEKFFTYIRADNEAALAAYTANGFELVGRARRHAKCGDLYVDELVVERFL